MSKINFSASGVSGIITSLEASYIELDAKIKELNTKKENLANIWSAAEATRFDTKLSAVVSAYEAFKTKYDGYLSLLNSVITSYSFEEESFVAAVTSISQADESSS